MGIDTDVILVNNDCGKPEINEGVNRFNNNKTKNGKVIVYKNKLYHDKTIRTKKPYAERIKTALDNGTAHYRDTLGKHIYMYELRRKNV